MCDAAEWDGPLYKCDFDSNQAAGTLLNDGLKLGNSHHWRDAMEKMTGQRENDAQV